MHYNIYLGCFCCRDFLYLLFLDLRNIGFGWHCIKSECVCVVWSVYVFYLEIVLLFYSHLNTISVCVYSVRNSAREVCYCVLRSFNFVIWRLGEGSLKIILNL